MLSVFGARRNVWPVDLSVTIWLMVPMSVLLAFVTVRPVVRPGSVVPATEPLARTLCELAWVMPLIEALAGPWLTPAAGFVPMVVSVFRWALAFALRAPWPARMFAPAFEFAPAPTPTPPCPPPWPGPATAGAA